MQKFCDDDYVSGDWCGASQELHRSCSLSTHQLSITYQQVCSCCCTAAAAAATVAAAGANQGALTHAAHDSAPLQLHLH
jgi:hypothetical protein